MLRILQLLIVASFILTIVAGPVMAWAEASLRLAPAATNTVFWISVDGLRPDYLDRAETPFFDQLRATGAYSREVWPVFPSVTFASHVSQATGVKPQEHGITGNSFYDSRTQILYRYPGDAELLEAEPIWITASRQGIRTAVLDWPLAHSQTGPVKTAYFGEQFERGLEDEQRLGRVLDAWENDTHEQPLQLIMGYVTSPDTEGHRYGPDAQEVIAAVEKMDDILSRTFERALSIWRKQNPDPDGHLFLVITSDHGMSQVTTLIHPGNLTGLEHREEVQIVTTGNVGHVHLDKLSDDTERALIISQTLARLSEFDYVRAFARDQIPEEWGMRHPTRTGDILLILDTGYTFSRRPNQIEMSAADAGGPLGMHGYDPTGNPEMLTPMIIHRSPEPISGEIPGEINGLQLHATISQLLGIDPAPAAVQEPILWEPALTR